MNVICCSKPWTAYDRLHSSEGDNWRELKVESALTLEYLDSIKPEYIFFTNWNWKVPKDILDKYECINLHMTPLPYGRGGSSLQNLIIRGNERTMVTAIRMTDEMDAGPIYCALPMLLSGSAEEIYKRTVGIEIKLIKHILKSDIVPQPQFGKPTYFQRRTPDESEIRPWVLGEMTLAEKIEEVPPGEWRSRPKRLYDFIRMLDAETYPRAFLETAGFKFEFSEACLNNDGKIKATVTITEKPGGCVS